MGRGKPAVKKATKKIAKKVVAKVTKPRQTKTIQETVAAAKATSQPSAGDRKLPRVNRRNKAATKKAANKKKAAKK